MKIVKFKNKDLLTINLKTLWICELNHIISSKIRVLLSGIWEI
jgi:hypothetical protein